MLGRVIYHGLTSARFERLPPDKLRKLQEKRMRFMIHHAYENTRFWHDWLDAGKLKPGDINVLEDLAKLPIASKSDLAERPSTDILAGRPEEFIRMSTSGTTGSPMIIYYSKNHYDYFSSIPRFRRSRFMGYSVLDKIIRIKLGMPKTGEDKGKDAKNKRTRKHLLLGVTSPIIGPLISRYEKTVLIGYDVEDALPEIMRFKPNVITGSPTYLRLLAEKVLSSGKDPPRLRTLVTGGEPLDEPTRDMLEKTFDCKTYNSYGAFDLGYIAMECTEKNGLHVMADSLFMEVIKDGEPVSPGERGDLVVTGLSNDAMPMLRYKLGDVGILSDEVCSCGRGFPLLKSMEGRSLDHVATASGAILSPKMVITMMHSVRHLPRSQLVQESSGSFTLRVFDQGEDNIELSVDEFLKKLRETLRENIKVKVSIEKPAQVKAKFRPLLSNQSINIDKRWVHPY